jgi:hypothetical protein
MKINFLLVMLLSFLVCPKVFSNTEFKLFLNTGSSADTAYEGNTFKGDLNLKSYYGSSAIYTNVSASSVPLYQTERNGKNLQFMIPVPSGTYTIKTYHNELYWGKIKSPAAQGKRVFDISLEGRLVKDNFDIFLSGNNETELVYNQIVVIDGTLNLDLVASVNNASISGISIVQNAKPQVSAGSNRVITLPTNSISLTATASSANGSIASYQWSKVSGPSATQSGQTTSKLNLSQLVVGQYIYQVSVKDNVGEVASASVTVQVNSAPVIIAPVDKLFLNAGSSTNATLEGKTFSGDVNLKSYYGASGVYTNAAASAVPLYQTERNGKNLQYMIPVPNGTYTVKTFHNELYWGKIKTPAAQGKRVFDISLEGKLVKDNFDIFLSGNKETELVFNQIVVSDGVLNLDLVSSVDNASISGISIAKNAKPQVSAGSNRVITLPTNSISLTATASSANGSIVSYQWSKVSGPSATQSGQTTNKLNLSNLVAGQYVYQVSVKDSAEEEASARVTVQVNPAPMVIAPVEKLFLNTGSSADSSYEGNTFKGDANLNSYFGTSGVYTNAAASTLPLFQTERNGKNLQYMIPVPNGTYTVKTFHNELYWGKIKSPAAQGKRVFDISLEGKLVKNDFDIFVVGNKETELIFNGIEVNDGMLNLDLVASVNNASISGISIVKNAKPTVSAGSNRVITLPTNSISLTATASSANGNIVSYQWSKVSGPAATQSGQTTSKLNLSNLVAGKYIYQVSIKDNVGEVASASVTVQVNPPPIVAPGDFKLFLNTGTISDSTYEGNTFKGDVNFKSFYGTSSVYSNVAASTLPLFQTERNGKNLQYMIPVPNGTYTVKTFHNELYWGKIRTPAAQGKRVFDISLEGKLVKDNFDIFLAGNKETELVYSNIVVNDGVLNLDLVSSVDNASISGISIAVNAKPQVSAGSNRAITLPTNSIQLSASASDPDGLISSYSWAKVSGPSQVSVTGASTSTLRLSNLVEGEYTYRIRVTDDQGATAEDRVTIVVNPEVQDGPNEGRIDVPGLTVIKLPLDSVALTASVQTPNGVILSYDWVRVSGPSSYNLKRVYGHKMNTLTFYDLVEGEYVWKLNVKYTENDTLSKTVKLVVQPADTGLTNNIISFMSYYVGLMKAEYRYSSPTTERTRVANWSNTIRSDGSWSDVDYAAGEDAMGRTQRMAQAWATPGHDFYQSSKIKQQVMQAVRYWCYGGYYTKHQNWYVRDISSPLFGLIPSVIHFWNDFSAADKVEIKKALSTRPGGLTGANALNIAEKDMIRGILYNEPIVMNASIFWIKGLLRRGFTESYSHKDCREGMTPDDSFLQHGDVVYLGGYGTEFIKPMAKFFKNFSGSTYDFNNEEYASFEGLILNGFKSFFRGKTLDYFVSGRSMTRVNYDSANQASVANVADIMSTTRTTRKVEFEQFRDSIRQDKPLEYSKNKVFFSSDTVSHIRPKFNISVHMFSKRMLNSDGAVHMESIRSHNIKDGSMLTYQTGKEYVGILPVWDWNRIPGTTSCHVDLSDYTKMRSWGITDHVGGVTDGVNGMAAMDFQKPVVEYHLSAKKAWFLFDEGAVALGTGIKGVDCPREMETVVEQNFATSSVVNLSKGIHHGNTAYIPLGTTKIQHEVKAQSGSNYYVNEYGSNGSKTVITKNVFTASIDHGQNPANASYAYVVAPGTTLTAAQNMSQSSLGITYVNNSTVQAVYFAKTKMIMASFYKAGTLTIAGRILKVDRPSLVIVKTSEREFLVSDPIQSQTYVNIEYTDESSATFSKRILFPEGLMVGSSTSMKY